MPIQVANIDLSAAVVGTSGSIPVGQANVPPTLAQQMRPSTAPPSTLKIHNESGCGLTCTWPLNGQTFTIPAGQWPTLYPPANETALNYVVAYVLPNAPVNRLFADLYLPGEAVYETGALGNSPINGAVAVTFPDRILDPSTNVGVMVGDGLGGGAEFLTPTALNRGIALEVVDGFNNVRDALFATPDGLSIRLGNFPYVAGRVLRIEAIISEYAGITTAGLGVPAVIAQTPDAGVAVGVTTLQNILSASPPADGMYLVCASVLFRNGTVPQSPTLQVAYNDIPTNAARTNPFTVVGASSQTTLNGANALGATNLSLAGQPLFIAAKAGTSIVVQWRNPGGTPNDVVFASICYLG